MSLNYLCHFLYCIVCVDLDKNEFEWHMNRLEIFDLFALAWIQR